MIPASERIAESDCVPISALSHLLYCPRRCALVHVERQWVENRFTAEGRVLHERADSGVGETRRGVRIERRVPLRSLRIGVFGFADVVEIREGNRPYPVEYKRGRPKPYRADEVQLCAQAICLEEMLGVDIVEGALFHGGARRRKTVAFDPELRALTERVAGEARRLIAEGRTPSPTYAARKCEPCSMNAICRPRQIGDAPSVERWLTAALTA